MREIILDTETTGLDPLRGDRLVEIGCVEIFNRMPTGQTYHCHINPEPDMPPEAFPARGWGTRLCGGGAGLAGPRAGWMLSPRAAGPTLPAAPSMAPCSTRNFWPKSTSI